MRSIEAGKPDGATAVTQAAEDSAAEVGQGGQGLQRHTSCGTGVLSLVVRLFSYAIRS